jgi:hypothetical protein
MTRNQTVLFAHVTSLWVEGKQTKDIIDTGNETATYKVSPPGSNVYIMDSIGFLICLQFHPSDPLAIYF